MYLYILWNASLYVLQTHIVNCFCVVTVMLNTALYWNILRLYYRYCLIGHLQIGQNIHYWYDHAGVLDDLILCGFRCAFSCMFQYYLYYGMDIGTCDMAHWSAAPHNRIANRTGFSVYVVLGLNVIRYSYHYLIHIDLFHHDFHHDRCDYHWDFYGH